VSIYLFFIFYSRENLIS